MLDKNKLRRDTMSIDDFLDIVRANLDKFLIKWENYNKLEPHSYPLTQDNFSEWWEQFIVFVEEEGNVDAN